MKRLEDMNLVDDFLAYSLTIHKTYGEEASRYILGCILQKKIRHLVVVPQKTWYGETPKSHGVRLDIYLDEEDGELYDLEPDQNKSADDAEVLPRRVRFYHSKIDAGNLAAGEDYKVLRNVVVIFITTYDPFGLNRMIYTIKNGCVEEPGLAYEDGARTIFLYTKGTKGSPSKELQLLARYLEHSTAENAGTAGLARLHEMVMEVKADREVGLAYMKAIEIEKRIREEGRAEGRAEAILDLLGEAGCISEELEKRIREQKNLEILRSWQRLAAKAGSAEEFESLILRNS
ncbi:MAG: hypothetical protein HFH87_16175 [Lachnospiraceae bacterium]|nr:hypothetical protein [Lachnospiraceae bacterium]